MKSLKYKFISDNELLKLSFSICTLTFSKLNLFLNAINFQRIQI